MASNSTTLADYYGKYPDWLEIYNPDTAALNLSGWKLKDNTTVWTIPANVTIPAQGLFDDFLRQARHDRPQRRIAHQLQARRQRRLFGASEARQHRRSRNIAPQYPQQYTDISYGLAMESTTTTLVNSGSTGKWTVPTAALPANWNTTAYSDTAWTTGTVPLGYNYEFPTGGNYFYGQFGANNTWNLYEVVSTSTTWVNAYNAARAKSVAGVAGHLVTIGSAAELNFIKGQFPSSVKLDRSDGRSRLRRNGKGQYQQLARADRRASSHRHPARRRIRLVRRRALHVSQQRMGIGGTARGRKLRPHGNNRLVERPRRDVQLSLCHRVQPSIDGAAVERQWV